VTPAAPAFEWRLKKLPSGKYQAVQNGDGFREFPDRAAAVEYIESCVTKYGDTFNQGETA